MPSITVDQPFRAFTPGETVTGHFHYAPGEPLPPRLLIVLEGRSKTKIVRSTGNSRSVYRGRNLLLSVAHPLNVPASQASQPSVPFALQIPELTSGRAPPSSGAWGAYWNEFKPYYGFMGSEQQSVLPPTMATYDRGVSSRFEGYVQYSITAGPQRICRPVPIGVLPVSPAGEILTNALMQTQRLAHSYEVKTLRLLSEFAERKLTFKEKSRSVFQRSSIPVLPFAVQCTVPKVLCPGKGFTISFQAKVKQNNLPETPPIKLHNVLVKLKADIGIRAPSLMMDLEQSTDELAAQWSLAIGSAFTESTDMRLDAAMSPLSSTTTPSFQSCNIILTHMLKIRANMEVAQKELELKLDYPVQVIGRYHEGDMQLDFEAPLMAEDDDDDAPPPYYSEDADKK